VNSFSCFGRVENTTQKHYHIAVAQCCAAICHLRPDSCVHKNWESRPPECLLSSSSSAWVKGGNHVFGECRWRHDYSRHPLLPGGCALHWVDQHCYIPTQHRAGRLHQQALSTSATGSPKLFFPTRSCIRFLLVSLVYMTFMFRTHKHIFYVTNIIVTLIF